MQRTKDSPAQGVIPPAGEISRHAFFAHAGNYMIYTLGFPFSAPDHRLNFKSSSVIARMGLQGLPTATQLSGMS